MLSMEYQKNNFLKIAHHFQPRSSTGLEYFDCIHADRSRSWELKRQGPAGGVVLFFSICIIYYIYILISAACGCNAEAAALHSRCRATTSCACVCVTQACLCLRDTGMMLGRTVAAFCIYQMGFAFFK